MNPALVFHMPCAISRLSVFCSDPLLTVAIELVLRLDRICMCMCRKCKWGARLSQRQALHCSRRIVKGNMEISLVTDDAQRRLPSVLLEFPVSVVEWAYLSGLEPSRDAVEVECVLHRGDKLVVAFMGKDWGIRSSAREGYTDVANSPRDGALLVG